MSRLILLGSPGTRRTVYLEKELKAAGADLELWDWKGFHGDFEKKCGSGEKLFMKIDPPRWESCRLEELRGLTGEYVENLQRLAKLGREGMIRFFNDPEAIKGLLDKRGCKRRLKAAGIPVTDEIEGDFSRGELKAKTREEEGRQKECDLAQKLLDAMKEKKITQVFLKPNYGSGAAGVMAFRHDPAKGQMALYTCAMEDSKTGRLVNTKRLRRLTDRRQVLSMVERLLETDCIVERWYAKAMHGKYSYDLRAVVQDGEIDFMLARLSPGPITNLQLNNHPLQAEELGLSGEVRDGIRHMCREAVQCYPGLRSVGIDILLEKRSLEPRIIEMNGQGDLIYQDIYGENRIYRKQARMMKAWMEEERQYG